MLTTNIAVELQLTNGTFGVISKIPYDMKQVLSKDENIYVLQSVPRYVIAKFQGLNIPKLPHLDEGEIPVFPIKSSFQFHFPGAKTRTNITRFQLPLVASYCYTAYKSQSKTLPAIVADLVPVSGVPIEPSFAYVPLSRVRSINDVVILRPFPISVIQAKRSNDLIAQDKRFEQMDNKNNSNIM